MRLATARFSSTARSENVQLSAQLGVLFGCLLAAAPVQQAFSQTGACCLPDNTCSALTQAACLAADGFWFGAGSGCPFVRCTAVGALSRLVSTRRLRR